MSFKIPSVTLTEAAAAASTSEAPVAEEEYYSSWSLFLVCMLLMLSLLTSYYLQIKRIRAVHETLVSIFAGMFVGLVVRIAPGEMIREMLVSKCGIINMNSRQCHFSMLNRHSNIPYSSICFCRPLFSTRDTSLNRCGYSCDHMHSRCMTWLIGKLLSQLWLDSHFRLPWDLHLRSWRWVCLTYPF